MRALLSIAILNLSVSCAAAAEVDLDALTAFETICIRITEPLKEVPEAMEDIGFPQIEPGMAKRILSPQTGRVWGGERTRFPLLFMLTDLGVCGVFAGDADLQEVRNLVSAVPDIKAEREEREGTIASSYYSTAVKRLDGKSRNLILKVEGQALLGAKGVKLYAVESK